MLKFCISAAVLPSLALFQLLPMLLDNGWTFWAALSTA
jgi:hypothetical protein